MASTYLSLLNNTRFVFLCLDRLMKEMVEIAEEEAIDNGNLFDMEVGISSTQ